MRFFVEHGKISGIEVAESSGGKFSSTNYCFQLDGSDKSYIFNDISNKEVDPYDNTLCEGEDVSVVHKGDKSDAGYIKLLSIRNYRSELC